MEFDFIESSGGLVAEINIPVWNSPFGSDFMSFVSQDPEQRSLRHKVFVKLIRKLADEGLSKVGHHGPASAMGVPLNSLPKWDDLQFVVGQLHKLPLLDDEPVGTDLTIGPNAAW